MLNKKSSIPLYSQIQSIIQQRIESGEYPLGGKIHSENELCQEFNVGRPTVRQALSKLIQEKKIESHRGKGVFVIQQKGNLDLLSSMGTTVAFKKLNLPIQTKVLAQNLTKKIDFSYFKSPHEQETIFIEIVRLRLIDDIPIIWETSLIKKSIVPGLAAMNLKNLSLTKILTEKFNLSLSKAQQNFSAKLLPTSIKKWFKKSNPVCMLYIEREIEVNHQSGNYFSKLYIDTQNHPLSQEILTND